MPKKQKQLLDYKGEPYQDKKPLVDDAVEQEDGVIQIVDTPLIAQHRRQQ
jgi:hypothetical protein